MKNVIFITYKEIFFHDCFNKFSYLLMYYHVHTTTQYTLYMLHKYIND